MKNITEPFLLKTFMADDDRGTFCKPISPSFPSKKTPFEVVELYWSKSAKGTIRGMHFQVQPFEGWKAVWVSQGAICDVVVQVDHTKQSPNVFEFFLSEKTSNVLIIPPGFAHGFQSLEENSIVNYAVSSMYSPEHDRGIRWDSFGYSWPEKPKFISDRDLDFPTYSDYYEKA